MTRSRTRAAARIAAALAIAGGPALAAPLRATVSFPAGIEPGRAATFQVSIAPGEEAEAGRRALEDLRGQAAALVLEGGQYGRSAQIPIGEIGSGQLQGRITPESAGPHRISLRFGDDGRYYAQVAEISLPARPGAITFEFERPESRARVPLLQLLAWASGALVFGLLALRGAFAF